jgi:hypothetical protein
MIMISAVLVKQSMAKLIGSFWTVLEENLNEVFCMSEVLFAISWLVACMAALRVCP